MVRRNHFKPVLTMLALAMSGAVSTSASAQLTSVPQFFQVDAAGTFLRTSGDSPVGPTIIFLGVGATGTLQLNPTGSYRVAGGGPTQTGKFSAVFSSSNVLLANNDLLNRVPGAIDIGSPLNLSAVNGPSFYGNVPMDIGQDFFINDFGLSVVIPAGASYLFVGVTDNYYADNSSPNPSTLGLYASIENTSTVPEPGTYAMMAVGMLGLVGVQRMRRRTGV